MSSHLKQHLQWVKFGAHFVAASSTLLGLVTLIQEDLIPHLADPFITAPSVGIHFLIAVIAIHSVKQEGKM
jgi:hypothetical protein